ncbi:MAG: peptidoglycan editing factor PgeF [Pseudomonadota bacterium]
MPTPQTELNYIVPNWSAPKNIRAVSTTRIGGYSQSPFNSFNLGIRAGDDVATVRRNRDLFKQSLDLAIEPMWLWQVHGNNVVAAAPAEEEPQADASWSRQLGQACVVLSADCLPVLLCDREGTCVGAAHAGWRGLVGGVIDALVHTMPVSPDRLMAWLGPCIGPTQFEVGADVYTAYCDDDLSNRACFAPGLTAEKWVADLQGLARLRLKRLGVAQIDSEARCTVSDAENFFSYRREGATSGRMATLIWRCGDAELNKS